MELLQLKYFKTVAEIGKISAAAESLFISAPALSTSIARLEKELGYPLFDRTNNSICLNRQGQILLRYVNQVFSTLDCAKAELRQSLLQHPHHVSVATFASNTWVDLISAFSQEHPQFTLSLTSMRLSQFSANGLLPQYTFLLADEWIVPPAYAEEMESIPLADDSVMVMVHPAHLLAKKTCVRITDLANENLLLPMQDYAFYELLMRFFADSGQILASANSYAAVINSHMAAEGLGVAFTTQRTAHTIQGKLCYIPLDAPDNRWKMRLYWRKNHPLTADERQFLDFVKRFYEK